MIFTKHKKNIEVFFKEKLPFLYNIGYIRKRLENNSLAFSYSFKLLRWIYNISTEYYKFVLAFLYLIWMLWQAYMISEIVPFSEGFYYIGLEYSAVLMIKILTILILTIGMCFMTVWVMFFLPFFIACIIPALLIGNALFDYREFLIPHLVPGITVIYILWVNYLYYRSDHSKQIRIKAGVIMFYIFAGLFFIILNTGVVQKETNDVTIELRDERTIEWELHFYNGSKYFVSYTDEETGETTREIVNSISTISIEYK